MNRRPFDMPYHDDGVACEYRGFIKVYRELFFRECSVPEIATKLQMDEGVVRRMVQAMRASGIAGVKRVEKHGRAYRPVYGVGADECVGEGSVKAIPIPTARGTAFASLIRSMRDRASAEQIADSTGIGVNAVRRFLRVASKHRIVYVVEWAQDVQGRWSIPLWRLGNTWHVERPAPKTTAEKSRAYQSMLAARRQHQQMIAALCAPIAA